MVTIYAAAVGDPQAGSMSNPAGPALGKHGHVTTLPANPGPTLPDANLRYQDALDWRKWTKGRLGWDFPFCPRSFEKAVMVVKW